MHVMEDALDLASEVLTAKKASQRQSIGKFPWKFGGTLFLGLVAVALMVNLQPAGAWAHDDDYSAKFYGEVQSLPTSGLVGDWLVSGRVVHVTATTRIEQEHGLVAVGSWVEVKGQWLSDHTFQAYEIEVKRSGTQPPEYQKLVGAVEDLPTAGLVGDWKVAGVTVHVSESTRIEQEHGTITIGSWVKVEGNVQADGSFDAFEIELLSHMGTTPPFTEKRFAVLKLQAAPAAPPEAEGVALVRSFAVAGSVVREDLKVAVEHLLPAQIYEVFVDAFHAGSILTNAEGEGYLFLSSASIPGAEPLPSELSPVTDRQQVEIRQGQTSILTGDFANASWCGDGYPEDAFLAMAPLVTPDGTFVGAAVAKIRGGEQELKLMAFALPGSTEITVVVDGLVLGTVFTSASGSLHVTFSTSPDGDDLLLPAEALPISAWQQISLQDATGQLASGSFLVANQTGVPGKLRLRIKSGKQ